MDASLLAVLNDAELALAAETEPAKLRKERLEAARVGRRNREPGGRRAEPKPRRKGPPITPEPTGDRAKRSPASEKERAGTLAKGARWQARRDSKGAG